MRIVFLGTPEFAVPTLRRLAGGRGFEVAAVVCQPDRPAGRKGEIQAPAVKRAALELGLEVRQPERMRGEAELAWLREQRPDALVVVAFGQILPRAVFELPRHGAINAHASLLPAYRGAAPIQWAIANGEAETGVTTMRINAGLDTGDKLLRRALAIGANETAAELGPRLAGLAADLMVETLAGLEAGTIEPAPQPREGTLAPILTRADGAADWRRPAGAIYNQWRGFQPWPGLHTRFRDRGVAIVECRPLAVEAGGPPGTLFLDEAGGLAVACGEGRLRLERVRPEGRQTMTGAEFGRGARVRPSIDLFGPVQ